MCARTVGEVVGASVVGVTGEVVDDVVGEVVDDVVGEVVDVVVKAVDVGDEPSTPIPRGVIENGRPDGSMVTSPPWPIDLVTAKLG
jgi:tRNA A37 threonylcarbamoyltransferase TsaD